MALRLMIAGTMSSAGKSYIVTGLCRYYARMGYKVAPFKSQNMALNSYVTVEGDEIGRAQAVQAYAAGVKASKYMNPILLKPTTDMGSQVIVMGRVIGNMRAREYYQYKRTLIPIVMDAFDKLDRENDIIIIEGAGSIAEINLKSDDLVNMGLAQMVDAPVLLVGDIDPGGVFAQLAGSLSLIDEEERDRVKGVIINKFRGDPLLLKPGTDMLEKIIKKKVLGVVPMSKAAIEEEDSITSAFNNKDGSGNNLNIAVVRLPRISNFTDFAPLQIIDGVNVRYVSKASELGKCDLIILPGSKNTISDLKWMKANGLFDVIKGYSHDTPIMGICGGYQMLGRTISDPYGIEGETESEIGLGLIDMETVLDKDKTLKGEETESIVDGAGGMLEPLNGLKIKGYEIHNGCSRQLDTNNSSYPKSIFGSYVHGIFENKEFTNRLIHILAAKKGIMTGNTPDYSSYKMQQMDIIADSLSEHLDMKEIWDIMNNKS